MEPLERAEGFRTRFGRTVGTFSRVARYRRGVWGGLAACTATALSALALPVPSSEPGAAQDRHGLPVGIDLPTRAPEDLRLFLDSQRWGDETPREVQERVARAEASAAKRQVRDEVGVVGLVHVKNRRASLIQLPDGSITRFVSGDTLPDGRRVQAMTSRAVTLEGDEAEQPEMLVLFPPIRQKPKTVEPVAETREQVVEPDAKPAAG